MSGDRLVLLSQEEEGCRNPPGSGGYSLLRHGAEGGLAFAARLRVTIHLLPVVLRGPLPARVLLELVTQHAGSIRRPLPAGDACELIASERCVRGPQPTSQHPQCGGPRVSYTFPDPTRLRRRVSSPTDHSALTSGSSRYPRSSLSLYGEDAEGTTQDSVRGARWLAGSRKGTHNASRRSCVAISISPPVLPGVERRLDRAQYGYPASTSGTLPQAHARASDGLAARLSADVRSGALFLARGGWRHARYSGDATQTDAPACGGLAGRYGEAQRREHAYTHEYLGFVLDPQRTDISSIVRRMRCRRRRMRRSCSRDDVLIRLPERLLVSRDRRGPKLRYALSRARRREWRMGGARREEATLASSPACSSARAALWTAAFGTATCLWCWWAQGRGSGMRTGGWRMEEEEEECAPLTHEAARSSCPELALSLIAGTEAEEGTENAARGGRRQA
ncbi:hypothetical protein C8R44DRAFT_754138 [Mycena epipterygia]|nr:hypothetical protein C8R44DRAFT_754138 [Mycena epipterygia]